MPAQTHRGRRAAQERAERKAQEVMKAEMGGWVNNPGAAMGATCLLDVLRQNGLRIVAARVPKPRKGEP